MISAPTRFTLSDWILDHLTRRKSEGKKQSLIFVIVLTFSIASADYASGIRISLAVFYLLPLLLATAWFGRRVGVAFAILSFALRILGDFASNQEMALPFWSLWNSCSALLIFLFIVWVFSSLLVLYRSLERRVIERTTALSAVAEERAALQHDLLQISARERSTMGQELHDDICQHLVGTTLAAKVLAQRLSRPAPALVPDAENIIGMLEEGTAKTRRLARGLLLASIEPGDFTERLRDLTEEAQQAGVNSRFFQAGDLRLQDAAVAAQLYRIAQEAMRNAVKHSAARSINLSIMNDDEALCLLIEDDGKGLPANRDSRGMGLKIMSHRAAYVGGTLSLISSAGLGTRVICRLPFSTAAA